MSDELKPCPFCGKPGLIRREGDHHGEWFNLGCVADVTSERPCPGACPWYTSDLEILADAIAAWNRRADAPLPDDVRAAVEAEQSRWQKAIYESCVKCSGKADLDGSGCDSGDPLDLSTTEIEMAINHVADQRDDLQRQLDELVGAVRASDRAHHVYQHARATGVDPEVVDNALFDNMARASLRLSDLVDRIKTTQPKGEWIDIEPDGSNLPDYVEGAEWLVIHRNGLQHWMESVYLFGPRRGDVIACWSIPHIIERRPRVLPYQFKESSDG